MTSAPGGYFDAASTEPLHPAARTALLEALDGGWADPARLYGSARRARMLLDAARAEVADVLGVRPDEVFFTSSGTQAVHLAVLGGLRARRRAGRHLVVTQVEHSSVLHAAELHERDGGEVTRVGVDGHGRVDPAEFAAALRPDTALACLQSANHEVGTVQPVAEVAEACRAARIPLFVDAAQSVGRTDVPGGWSTLAASAHKWGGPAGVGVLVIRKNTRWRSPLPDDEREGRRVPGSRTCRPRPPRRRRCARSAPRWPPTVPGCRRWWTGSAGPSRRRCRTCRWWATRCGGCRTSSPSPACTSRARRC